MKSFTFTTLFLILTLNLNNALCSGKDFNESFKDDRVVTWHFGNSIKPGNKSISFELKFFVPTQPGTYPVVLFLTGLDGLAQAFMYTEFITKLVVSSDFIVVAFNSLKYPSLPDKEEHLFEQTVNWTLDHLNELIQGPKTPEIIKNLVFPDLKSNQGVTLMGHSAAAHPVVGYLVSACGLIKSLVLLDPVDGFDPFGLIKIFVTHPPNPLVFVIPTLVITTGYDTVPTEHYTPACAPANISNTRFYICLDGPTWMLNFTEYGHADVLDDWIIPEVSVICKMCPTDCKRSLYRTNLANAISYFLRGLKERDQKYINALEYPIKSGLFDERITIESIFKHNNYDVLKTGPFCSRASKQLI